MNGVLVVLRKSPPRIQTSTTPALAPIDASACYYHVTLVRHVSPPTMMAFFFGL